MEEYWEANGIKLQVDVYKKHPQSVYNMSYGRNYLLGKIAIQMWVVPSSVLQLLNMDYGASAHGNFLLLCSSANFVGYSYQSGDARSKLNRRACNILFGEDLSILFVVSARCASNLANTVKNGPDRDGLSFVFDVHKTLQIQCCIYCQIMSLFTPQKSEVEYWVSGLLKGRTRDLSSRAALVVEL